MTEVVEDAPLAEETPPATVYPPMPETPPRAPELSEEVELPPYEARNPRYNTRGSIDCEILHEVYGWIPFTAIPEDDQVRGQNLYAALVAGEWGEIAAAAGFTDEQKLSMIAEKRWSVETGGITVSGFAINTEDRSKTLLNGSAIKALRNPEYTLRWKTPDGFIDLTSAQVLTLAGAVADFVQACFDREDALIAAVTAGTFTVDQLDQGWPNVEVPQQAPN